MIEILKETARYLVCVKPIGIAAQGTQAGGDAAAALRAAGVRAFSPFTGSTRRSAA